jgi:hypothetical protein
MVVALRAMRAVHLLVWLLANYVRGHTLTSAIIVDKEPHAQLTQLSPKAHFGAPFTRDHHTALPLLSAAYSNLSLRFDLEQIKPLLTLPFLCTGLHEEEDLSKWACGSSRYFILGSLHGYQESVALGQEQRRGADA